MKTVDEILEFLKSEVAYFERERQYIVKNDIQKPTAIYTNAIVCFNKR